MVNPIRMSVADVERAFGHDPDEKPKCPVCGSVNVAKTFKGWGGWEHDYFCVRCHHDWDRPIQPEKLDRWMR